MNVHPAFLTGASRRGRLHCRASAICAAVALVVALLGAHGTALAAPTYADVAPIFNSRCTVCHTGASAPKGLRLDSYESILGGGKSGPAVIAGSAQSSELVKRIRGERQPRMPLTGPPYLSDAEIALVETWIQAGAQRGAESPVPQRAVPAPAVPVGAPAAVSAAPVVVPGAVSAVPPAAMPVPAPAALLTYAEIEPILLSRCVKCHVESGGQMGPPPGGYVLRTYAQALAAGERVRIVPGNAGASELLRRVKGQARPRMPFDGPPWLSDEEIALIGRWIAEGARDRGGKPAPVPVGAEVRLRGTLTAPGEIDGVQFRLDGVRTDRNLGVGGAAEMRGVVEADGAIRATRLRSR